MAGSTILVVDPGAPIFCAIFAEIIWSEIEARVPSAPPSGSVTGFYNVIK